MPEDTVKMGWVAGWGIDPEELQSRVEAAFPALNHEVILPGKIEASWPRAFPVVVGWSWGAYRLLEWAATQREVLATSPRSNLPKLLLIAPFRAFCSEAGQGGRFSRSQVKWLLRWLKRDPEAALADFYDRAQLAKTIDNGAIWVRPNRQSPHLAFWEQELKEMETGILDLPNGRFAPPASHRIQSWIGMEDSLLDPAVIASSLDATTVPGAGHNISDFFSLLTKDLPAS